MKFAWVCFLCVSLYSVGCSTYQRTIEGKEASWSHEAANKKWFEGRTLDPIEGIWSFPFLDVAIVKDKASETYVGYVVRSRLSSWWAGDRRLEVAAIRTRVYSATVFTKFIGPLQLFVREGKEHVELHLSPKGNFLQFVDGKYATIARRAFPVTGLPFRDEFIADYFDGAQLDPIEGVWLVDSNKYELGVVRFGLPGFSSYQYVGIVLESRRYSLEVGEAVAFLRQTASPKVYPSVVDGRDTNILLESPNLLKYASTSGRGYYARTSEVLGIRLYPKFAGSNVRNDEPDLSRVATGTAFAISEDLVVTNYHVIDEARTVTVNRSGERTRAFVAAQDKKNDLAILKLAKPIFETDAVLPLGDFNQARPGDRVFTIGFPLSGDLGTKHRVVDGIISSAVGMDDDPRMFQLTIPIQPGNSGGPLLTEDGSVIGIVTSMANPNYFMRAAGTVAQNISFAIKVNYLDVLLTELGQARVTRQPAASVKPAELMERYREAVVLVEAGR